MFFQPKNEILIVDNQKSAAQEKQNQITEATEAIQEYIAPSVESSEIFQPITVGGIVLTTQEEYNNFLSQWRAQYKEQLIAKGVSEEEANQISSQEMPNELTNKTTRVIPLTSANVTPLTGNNNESKIYNYLTSKGFNNAAVCGILSNIDEESKFNPTSIGDNGTSYGICQWHDSRWTDLKNYCNSNGLDSTTLEGQLDFLVYELEHKYPSVYKTFQTVPNTAEGAYQAAYTWTVDFEIPASKYTVDKYRGNNAKNGYWNNYGI